MSHTLVLNRSFYAVQIAHWQRAVTMLYQGHAEVVDDELATYDFDSWRELSTMMAEHPAGFVHTATMRIALPEVIRLTRYDSLPRREVTFTRHNVYEHYRYTCCYCGERLRTSELNLDHVVPRSRGGTAAWENIVTACVPCNTKKANRMPSEAGMRLLVRPSKPKWAGLRQPLAAARIRMRESWQKLIDRAYWDGELSL